MFKKILFPVDIQEINPDSIGKVIDIAKSFSAKIIFMHVQPYPTLPMQDDGTMMTSIAVTDEYLDAISGADISPDRLVSAIELAFPQVKTCNCEFRMLRGLLAETVAEVTIKDSVELVVTEHRHVHGAYHWLFRSNDENILQRVNVPVLVLPR
jgi:nucleotide-binding universal stress UspA family protein